MFINIYNITCAYYPSLNMPRIIASSDHPYAQCMRIIIASSHCTTLIYKEQSVAFKNNRIIIAVLTLGTEFKGRKNLKGVNE